MYDDEEERDWLLRDRLMTNQASTRVKIDAQLRDQTWVVESFRAVGEEFKRTSAASADRVLKMPRRGVCTIVGVP